MPPLAGARAPTVGSLAARLPNAAPVRQNWHLAIFPVGWMAGVLLLTLTTGLGKAEDASEQAVALVRSYVAARQSGDAALACSKLTPGQQRELVAIQSGDRYESATASRCPEYILETQSNSHLLNPALPELAAAPRIAYASPGIVVITSPDTSRLALTVVSEGSAMKLDVRGVERMEFKAGCARTGVATAGDCECAFERLRAEGRLPESQAQINTSWQQEARAALAQCEQQAGAPPE